MKCAARRIIAPVAALALIAFGQTAGAADNPAAPIAASAGHPSLHHLQAQEADARDGAPTQRTLDVDGTRRLERVCGGDVCHGSWFDGSENFTFGINGTPFHERAQDDRLERTFAAIASTAFAEPAFLAAGGRVAELSRRADSQRYEVTAPGGSALIAVADARSHQLSAVERPDGDLYSSLIVSGTAGARIYAPRPYDRVVSLSAGITAPAGPPVTFEGPAHATALLPGPLPIVACQLAGQAARCLIDSGTTPSAVSLALAERLGREPHGSIEITGLGSYVTGVIDAVGLHVGPVRIDGLQFAVVPHLSSGDFDVIIGTDALAELRLELDPGAGTARFGPSQGDLSDAPLGVDFSASLPLLQARLAGLPATDFLVDTGDSGSVSIGYDQYRTNPELFTARRRSQATGVGSPALDAVEGVVASLDVGAVHFEQVSIAAVRGQHRGHLGYGFAARCGRLFLELGRRRIGCAAPLTRAHGPAGQ